LNAVVVGQERTRPHVGRELVLADADPAAAEVLRPPDAVLTHVDRGVAEGARDERRHAHVGQSPAAVFTAKLERDSSQMSNSAWRKARKKISSGESVMTTGRTPSMPTLPSISGRVRS
jgi:hypothetical protein